MDANVGDSARHLSDDELASIATDAYLYLYPLVMMETSRRVLTNTAYGVKVARGPMGAFVHTRAFPPASFKAVVRPNFDTLYSSAWLDLTNEPYIISLPAFHDRFFMLPLYDMWTEIFASPGTRTNGSEPFTFALCDPSWHGVLPSGVERIDAPTSTVWIIGRTETRGEDDYANVHALQDAMRLAPLSTWPAFEPPPFVKDERVDMSTPPMLQVEALGARDFFLLASELLTRHASHPTDWGIIKRMERTGFVVGRPFDLEQVDAPVRTAYEKAHAGASMQMHQRFETLVPFVNGWSSIGDMGVWGNAYLKRAMIALAGLGANPPEESLYPNLQRDDHGEALDGASRYVLRFEADATPPVEAFWSLTVYDPRGFPVANELNRCALGDRDHLIHAADGSLEILLAHERPDDEWIPNWLPVPLGRFMVTLRLYLPRAEALNGRWTPPPARRLD